MNFAVCGDSWFSSDTQHPGKSFAEKIAEKNNWNLISLARSGCSNFAISLQVDKAIELGCDLIIVGCTTPDRIEIPKIDNENKSIWERLKENFSWKEWFNTQPEVYKLSKGLSNVWYKHQFDLSTQHGWLSSPTIISESMNNLFFENSYNLSNDQIVALKYFMCNLYDNGIKRQTDCWIMSDAARRLVQSKIPFLLTVEPLFDPGDRYQQGFQSVIDWVDKKNLIYPNQFSYYNLPQTKPGMFHYDINQGAEIFADYIQQRIEELL